MKNVLFMLLVCTTMSQIQAQKYADLSLNILSFYGAQTFELSYEKGLSSKWSIEAGVGTTVNSSLSYRNGQLDTTYLTPDTTILFISESRTLVPAQRLSAFIGARRYFKYRMGTDRFFVGLGLLYQTYVHIDESYPNEKPNDTFLARIPVGYKFIIRNKIPIELGGSFVVGGANSDGFSYPILDLYFIGKIGYRFGSNPQE